jgi:EpsD family peptidyl-prolyl cis-trans isomerase
MKRTIVVGLVSLAAVFAATGLAQSDADRVVGRVGDEKITLGQVRAELPAGVTGPAAEAAALRGIINRKLLIDEALRLKLDKTPIGAMLLNRAQETAMAGLLEEQFAGTPPVISEDQVRSFVAANPLIFSGRRLVSVDQFISPDGGRDLTSQFAAANSMSDFEDILQRNHLTYQRTSKVLDTLNIEPSIAKQIGAMKVGDVFVTPTGPGVVLSGVTENRAAPISGSQAEAMARVILARRAVQAKVGQEVDKIVKAGQSDVQYNSEYKPK